VGRTSAIGLLTSASLEGPWEERGLAVTSSNSGPGTNAIDPSVVVTPSGQHWMVYGSSWDGLYELQLNPATGLALASGNKGTRIVRRGSTNGMINGNLEGPEIIFNPTTNMYYLFVAYDWLSTKYNVRVFRSANPNGPFLDWNGVNVDNAFDNGPMILAPYKFMDHGGWAGVSHCSVFKDGNQYFMAHQGRPGVDRAFMVMHVRKMFWTPEGWPIVSPERYANVPDNAVAASEIAGDYEQIVQGYAVVPGFDQEQTDPQYNVAFSTTLGADGKINGDANNTWSYTSPWLELRWAGGLFIDKLHVSRERDWEKKKTSTLVMTGLNGGGLSIWLKKK
jgi:arabinan endo-1,5-alpha-L-arabinosidase